MTTRTFLNRFRLKGANDTMRSEEENVVEMLVSDDIASEGKERENDCHGKRG